MRIETFRTKEDLKKYSPIKPNLFYYNVHRKSHMRGYNQTVSVYALRKEDLSPCCLGQVHIHTASYPGDHACAVQLLSRIFNYKTKHNKGYDLINKKVKLWQF